MNTIRRTTRTRRCTICGHTYYGYGHVAEPVAPGRCCDACHAQHVVPRRIRLVVDTRAEQNESP
jgi:hypothetical protein